MNHKGFLSISIRFVLAAGLCLLVTTGVLVGISAVTLRAQAYQAAEDRFTNEAHAFANQIDAELEIPMDTARALSNALSGIKNPEFPATLTRDQANALLRETLARNPNYLAVYSLWEPNAFDGQDAEFINAPGHDESGQFVPYWNRGEDDGIHLEPMLDYNNSQGMGAITNRIRTTPQEIILDPYLYPVNGVDVLMVSTLAPVEMEGRFLGLVGIDVRADFLQQLLDESQSASDLDYTILISNDGSLAGFTGSPRLVGKNIFNDTAEIQQQTDIPIEKLNAFHKRIQDGSPTLVERAGDYLLVTTPVYYGRTTTPWSVVMAVPYNQIAAEANASVWRQIAIGVAAAAAALVVLWLLTRQITRPIVGITEVARRVAEGDLDEQVTITSRDEVGVLANAFNEMVSRLHHTLEREQEQRTMLSEIVRCYAEHTIAVGQGSLSARIPLKTIDKGNIPDVLVVLGQNLNRMTESLQTTITQIRSASTDLASASAEIMAATSQQASGASEQSAAIAQTTATVEEVKTIAENFTSRAQQVSNVSQRTVEVSKAGLAAVEQTITSMTEIKSRVEDIAENILALSEQTQQIGEIIATVNEIASQSNMLALNASVEAARAGEHGKGFAVVAMEVRNLAEQSRQATMQVKSILQEIQKATNASVMSTEEGTNGVDRGVDLATQARSAIEQLSTVISESAQASVQMIASSQQQSTGIDQVALAMTNINQATVQSLASTRQAEKAAQNLNELSRRLTHTIDSYQ